MKIFTQLLCRIIVLLSRQYPITAFSKPEAARLKAFLLMRIQLIAIALVIGMVHLKANGIAQQVNLSAKQALLVDVFQQIKSQTGYQFLYNLQMLEKAHPVTIRLSNASLPEALDKCFQGQPLTFEIRDKTVIVKRRSNPEPRENRREDRVQQDSLIAILGFVSDSTGQFLVGATVKVADQSKQTKTDEQGRFTLSEVPVDALLEISYIGYKSEQIKASPRLYIRLGQSTESMKEVVITGLFERKAESFTGSTTTFSQEELLQVGNLNVVKSLANLDPSFRVLEDLAFGSDPNQLPDIQLRGQTGLPDLNNEYGTNPNLPLFILDGFETELQRIIDLDIYLIKSITLLKDAASKAVYGSRAANGVVVIETIRPPVGKLQVTYNYNLNMEFPDLSSYNLADARQKYDIEMMTDPSLLGEEMWTEGGNWVQTGPVRREYELKLNEILRGVNTYWLSQPLRNGIGQRHSLTLGGGQDELRYYLEMGYNNIQGVMLGSQRKIYNGGIQLTYRKRSVSISNILRLTSSRGDNSPYGSFSDFAEANPYLRLHDSTGNYNFYSPMHNGTIGVQDFSKEFNMVNNTELVWTIRPYLRLNGRLGLSRIQTGTDVFLPAAHNSFPQADPSGAFDPNSAIRGSYSRNTAMQNRMNTTLTLNYNKVFGKHALFANIGADANSVFTENYAFKVVGFPNAQLNYPTAAVQYAPESRLNGTENITRDMGFYTAVNYAYDDRYLGDLSWRRARSSQFGSANPDVEFWSAGVGWNIHNEAFMANNGMFEVLRLTANTGYTGTQPVNAYLGFPVYRYEMDNLYYGKYSLRLNAMANPMLGAQRKKDNNFSLNMGLLNSRLNILVDYYISTTDGLLIDLNLPYSTGYGSFKANQGKVENRGVDLRVNYQVLRNQQRGNFISVNGTLGHNRNQLKELSNTLIALTSSQDNIMSSALKQRFEVGASLNTIWAVPSLGIDPASGQEIFVKKDGSVTYDWDPADQVAAGNAIADLYGNFGFSIRFNGWQLNTSFAYNWGGQRYNTTLVDKVENIDRTKNVDARVFTSRWKQPGDQTFFKGINEKGITYPTTRFVEDWNELTLANANISYDLDRLAFVKSAGIRRLRASLGTTNAFVISSMRMERGTDYPFARTFSFTLQTNF